MNLNLKYIETENVQPTYEEINCFLESEEDK